VIATRKAVREALGDAEWNRAVASMPTVVRELIRARKLSAEKIADAIRRLMAPGEGGQ